MQNKVFTTPKSEIRIPKSYHSEIRNPHSEIDMVLIDAHVHCYPAYPLREFLEMALKNFHEAARRFEYSGDYGKVLCFTESPRESRFLWLQQLAANTGMQPRELSGWRFRKTEENHCLRIISPAQEEMMIIAGRQIVTRERLEVLALGTRAVFPDGQAIQKLLADAAAAGAIPVIPWGFGKWSGARGKVLKSLLHDATLPRFFLGDNGNRPASWPRAGLFRIARQNGIKDLPGSDPLPLTGQHLRAGSYGFMLENSISNDTPFQDLKTHLENPALQIHPFGQNESLPRFLHHQTAMQWRRVLRKNE